MSRLWRGITVTALSAGLLIAGALPAMAANPTVSIAAATKSKAVNGNVYVVYAGGKYASATISGSLTGAAQGEVVTLEATPFGGTTAAVGSVTLGTTHRRYSFTVTPRLATKYKAVLSSSGTQLATSTGKTVYVVASGSVSGGKNCARPVCKEAFRIVENVPASALVTEMAKHQYPYFGLSLGGTKVPAPPKYLYLSGGHSSTTKSKQISGNKFFYWVNYRFTIGNHSYYWLWATCSMDSEATDGMGLPGSHGCGTKRVSSSASYLG
jgi:hypothetical protein